MTGAPPIVVEVTRGDLVESVHRVAACALDYTGTLLYGAGEIDVPVFLRSAAKPFIAAAAVRAGVDRAFELDSREIAVMTASHFGQPFHVDAVRSLLRKIAMDPSALQCGVHWPYDDAAADALRRSAEAPSPLYNNCSGKHAGILALCKVLGADPATYLRADNPVQQFILAFCARLSGDDAATWPLAVDGCGIPVYATSLRNAALAFARFASLRGIDDADAAALRTVREAMLANPEYVAGTGQLDTELMIAAGGSVVAKAGAEGVHGIAALPRGYGYAAKVLDGGSRARGPSSLAVLRRLQVLDDAALARLARFAHPAVYNRAGDPVGEIRAVI